MKQFFKYFLASGLAYIIFGIIFFFIISGIISSMFNAGPKPIMVDENTVLHIDFSKPIGERTYSKAEFNGESFEDVGKIGVRDVTEAIKYAATDEKIKGIYLDLSMVNSGIATIEEVRNSLKEFKKSGKFVVAYAEIYSKSSYYIASLADEVYLYPTGLVDWNGLSTQKMFFKNMLSKLDIDMQIIRGSNNKFKSAVEPFMYDQMSDAARLQTERFLNSFWSHMTNEVSQVRDISSEKMNMIADSALLKDGESALNFKFITGLKYEDEVIEGLRAKMEVKEEDKVNAIPLNKYVKYSKRKLRVKNLEKKNIAVVYATGEIRSGKGNMEMIGSETTAKLIKEARENDSIKALVLRVNSPGGSALASDVIWREIMLTKKKKPVVVSMGDVAASGGYYISCAADRIFAQPNTITGSIGVFGMIPNMQGFFNNKLGITFDGVKTNKHADVMSINKPLSEEEYKLIQEGVDDVYDDFITKVSEGRGISKAMVDSIGQGRVWTGLDARDIKLVDEIGGLDDAIAYAAQLANIETPVVMELPKEKEDPFEAIMEALAKGEPEEGEDNLSVSARSMNVSSKWMKSIVSYLDGLQHIADHKQDRIQARLPLELVLE